MDIVVYFLRPVPCIRRNCVVRLGPLSYEYTWKKILLLEVVLHSEDDDSSPNHHHSPRKPSKGKDNAFPVFN
jgi:hypothetical protein